MALRFYNTLTAQVDEFRPLEGHQVRMYTCGPTVYDYAHIGNFRTFVFQDILRRYLRYRGYEVRQVMNLTDVDDKTIRNAREAGLDLRDFTMKYLGETFDIHSGGTDLAFPHHENEIAQSEAATGKPFARFWLHAEHLMVNGQRMAKSLGNFYTLRDLIDRNYKPTAIRYLLSEVPFRKPLNFTFD